MRKAWLVLVEVEHALSLTQSREVLWALPQPGDCGKSAWAPGPSLSDAPVSGLLGQVCFLHGTASFCPDFFLDFKVQGLCSAAE